jgi:hypothetical protein
MVGQAAEQAASEVQLRQGAAVCMETAHVVIRWWMVVRSDQTHLSWRLTEVAKLFSRIDNGVNSAG